MVENALALLVALVCAVLLVRLVLPRHLRQRFDRRAHAAGHALRRLPGSLRGLRHRRTLRREAAQAAEDAIRRAQRGTVEREGNVYRPKSFRDKRKLH